LSSSVINPTTPFHPERQPVQSIEARRSRDHPQHAGSQGALVSRCRPRSIGGQLLCRVEPFNKLEAWTPSKRRSLWVGVPGRIVMPNMVRLLIERNYTSFARRRGTLPIRQVVIVSLHRVVR
jgi:hypothetical protein